MEAEEDLFAGFRYPPKKVHRAMKREQRAKDERERFIEEFKPREHAAERDLGRDDLFRFAVTHLRNHAFDRPFHGLLARLAEHGHSTHLPPGDYYWENRYDLVKADGQVTPEFRIGDATMPLADRLATAPTNLDGSWRGFFIRICEDARWKEYLVPRWHLKTTFLTQSKTLWHIVRHPEWRHLICMNTLPNAKRQIRAMKGQFQKNDVFQGLWPELIAEFLKNPDIRKPQDFLWQQEAFDVLQPEHRHSEEGFLVQSAEASVVAAGIGSQKTSQHYHLIHWDDIVDETSITSPEQIENNIEDWLSTHDLCIGDLTFFEYVGTPWHYADVSQAMLDPATFGLKELNIAVATVEDYHGEPLYPKVSWVQGHPGNTRSKIMSLRAGEKTRSKFSAQQLMQPVASEEQSFPADNWGWYRQANLPNLIATYCSIDPAVAVESCNDWTVYLTFSVDEHGAWYIREVTCQRGIDDLIEQIRSIEERFHPIMYGYEGVSFQRACEKILQDASMRGELPALPIFACSPSTRISKNFRISRIVPRHQKHLILLPAGDETLPLDAAHQRNCVPYGIKRLIEEGERFPKGAHDDAIDALAQGIELAWQPAEEQKQEHEKPGAWGKIERHRKQRDMAAVWKGSGYDDPVLGEEGVDW